MVRKSDKEKQMHHYLSSSKARLLKNKTRGGQTPAQNENKGHREKNEKKKKREKKQEREKSATTQTGLDQVTDMTRWQHQRTAAKGGGDSVLLREPSGGCAQLR